MERVGIGYDEASRRQKMAQSLQKSCCSMN
jgi:hypothetical protein